MADKTVTVNTDSSGSPTYTSLNAALSGEDGATFNAFTGVLYINCSGATADAWADMGADFASPSDTHYVCVTGDNSTGKWDTNKYRIISDGFYRPLIIRTNYTKIIKLQFSNIDLNQNTEGVINYTGLYSGSSSVVTVERCVLKGVSEGPGFNNYGGIVHFINNVVYGWATGFSHSYAFAAPTSNVYNCTIVANATGINSTNNAITVKNTYVQASGTEYSGTGFTLTTCAHASSTSYTGSTGSVAYSTANFVNVTAESEDLHLTSGSALIGQGTDLSGTFTTDIDGETRSGTWDIGADEYVAAGGTRTTKNTRGAGMLGMMAGMSRKIYLECDYPKPIGGV